MSSRARRIIDPGLAQPFAWSLVGAPPATGADAPGRRLDAPDGSVPPPEQQAHLAALERDAFAKGYSTGERAGVEAGAKRVDAMLRRVAQTLEDLGSLRKKLIRETEREIVQLTLTLAERVVGRQLALDPDLLAAMAHVGLERLGENVPATIRLNPEDYTTIAAQRGEQWEGPQVNVIPDPAVARGSCLVDSEFGMVDASLSAQFDELSRVLLADGREPAAREAPGGR
jgi:flagellar assembly protein FliH